MPNTILLRGDLALGRREKLATPATIKPGMVIEVDATDKFILQATADVQAECIVALEDTFQGKTIDDLYAAGDRVSAKIMHAGEEFYGFLKAGANATEASYLCYNGDGSFDVVAAGEVRVAKPVEPVDNSGGGTAARIKVRRL